MAHRVAEQAAMQRRIAIVNDHRWIQPVDPDTYVQNILTEDALLTAAFEARGLATERVDWAEPGIDWRAFDAALIRQTWDYFERYSEFCAWLDRIEHETRVFNPIDIVRWNGDKRYLLDIAAAGVPTVSTRVMKRQQEPPALGALLAEPGWNEAVVKPAVSGAGRETFRASHPVVDEIEARWRKLLRAEDMLIQPFMPSIVDRGEVSLVVLAGSVTHAVRKIAAPGEFRVQDDHGGTVHEHAPTAAEIAISERAIAAIPGDVAYARVDLVDGPDGPLIMELELIEPELFLRHNPGAADRLAGAIVAALTDRFEASG